MSESLQAWANIAQIISLPIAVLSLIIAILTWLNPPRSAITAFFNRVRPYLLTISIAAFTFWLGTRTIPAVPSRQPDAQATIESLNSTITALEAQSPMAVTRVVPVTQIIPNTQVVPVTRVTEVTKVIDVTKVSEVTATSIPTTPTPNPSILFEDDFTAAIKPEWNMKGANFTVVDGTLSSQGSLEGYLGDVNWVNYIVEFDLLEIGASSQDNGFKLQINKQDNSNYMTWHLMYFPGYGGCRFLWTRTVRGEETVIVNTERRDIKCRGHFKIESNRNTYNTIHDGAKLLSFTDNTFANGGISLISNSSDMILRIDNFQVSKFP